MSAQGENVGATLERFRTYLSLLARLHVDQALRSKLDSSDLVQDVLMGAHQNLEQCKGKTDEELIAWLRGILAHKLNDARRRFGRDKRNVARERSLETALEESSARLEAWLVADQSTPSQRAAKNEQLLQLSEALTQLPKDQRDALELNRLKGMTRTEVGRELGCSEGAVAGLVRRGLENLRKLLGAQE